MARFKNIDWNLSQNANGQIATNEGVAFALLMDIRDELQRLNSLLHCPNFVNIPAKLDRIGRNTAKPKPRRLKVAK